ncbi:MAG: endolytic transglycosylase MltG [Myxococcales bacterium]|nr:endolytic transglycosylase MltG [Myxococcales bacterium]
MRLVGRLALVLLLLAGGAAGYGWYRLQSLDRPMGPAGTVQVEIPKGASFRAVTRILADAGVLDDPLTFELYGRYRNAGHTIKAGVYTVDRAWTPRRLLDELASGALPPQVRVTLPEGLNRWQVADALAEAGLVDRDAFLQRVAREQLEGRLFPDTYDFHPDADLDTVVRRLTRRFDAVLAELTAGRPDAEALRADGPERQRLLILASLVEKEARTDRDRPLVARVFENRLARGMKLQTDPTCVYDAALYTQVPHPRYCRDPKNRYSTYVIDGLPPGPIANPGRAALKATLNPALGPEAEKLLFFVARRDGSGEHHFSATLAEHERAVRRHLGGGGAAPRGR